MTSLDSILNKLHLHPESITRPLPKGGPNPQPPSIETQPVKVRFVDVIGRLDRLAASAPTPLNWRTSVADLLALLELDNSPAAMKELTLELGCPASEMRLAARRNRWLHRTVMQKIAENGGNVPQDLRRK